MEMEKKHSFEVHRRAFVIWQKLGYNPWKRPAEKKRKGTGDFYRGAWDNIPFLNEDAKRTFQHLLFRPGYMIRDYIKGDHERYLAPLTALIIFFSFFGLVSAVLQPVQKRNQMPNISIESEQDTTRVADLTLNIAQIVQTGYIYLNLDQHPEVVDTQYESSLAALEGALRNQGIPLFIDKFFILWLAMYLALKRHYRQGLSACAAASAYILCQFSFFMLFAVILTFGKSTSIGLLLMLALLVIDYRQWLGLSWKKSLRRAIATGIHYGLIFGACLLAISLVVVILAFFRK